MESNREHSYSLEVRWSGNLGTGTSDYSAYSRSHDIIGTNKPVIVGSADPSFRGDRDRYNPEELLVASLSSCHMLWYLHLCSDAGIVAISYVDNPIGTMVETRSGEGYFQEVILQPIVCISGDRNLDKARELHEEAHRLCFIANSVNFPVRCNAQIEVVDGAKKPESR